VDGKNGPSFLMEDIEKENYSHIRNVLAQIRPVMIDFVWHSSALIKFSPKQFGVNWFQVNNLFTVWRRILSTLNRSGPDQTTT